MSTTHGQFVWVDLSTFRVEKTKRFYGKLFGWSELANDGGYGVMASGGAQAAGIYEMPAFFQKIKMPSFWMSYIAVDDIDQTVALAENLGAKVELQEENAMGRVALIRDPLGAGFTCVEGDQYPPLGREGRRGQCIWNELFVSDRSRVETFYTRLFGWTLEADKHDSQRAWILDGAGERISAMQQAPEAERGDKEYWAVVFGVDDLAQAEATARSAGGAVYGEIENSMGAHVLAVDPDEAFFLLRQCGASAETSVGSHSLKWRAALGLALVYAAVGLEWNWIWGVLFLVWVLPDLKSGTTYFIEPVSRAKNPLLYWGIVVSWLWMAAYVLITNSLQ